MTDTAPLTMDDPTDYSCARCSFAVSGPNATQIAHITLLHDADCIRSHYTPALPIRDGSFIAVSPDSVSLLAWLGTRIRRRSGWWNPVTATTSAMGALVPHADDFPGHTPPAGWPDWLPRVVHELYDADTGAADEQDAADTWLHDLATLFAVPIDYDAARHHFTAAVLSNAADLDSSGLLAAGSNLHQQSFTTPPPSPAEWQAFHDRARHAVDAIDPEYGEWRQHSDSSARAAQDACSPFDPVNRTWRVADHAATIAAEHAGRSFSDALTTARLDSMAANRDLLIEAMRASQARRLTAAGR